MRLQIRQQLQALGPELAPAMLQGTSALMAQGAAPVDGDVEVLRDLAYGPDDRHRLDVFRRGAPASAPVLVYVHGGGFVMGNKSVPGSPFYGNVGQWAAQQGYVGVTLTYRLAPQHRWPSGPEDLSLAVRWLQQNIAALGGDPQAIFLMGQSAGAVHVGSYVAHARFHAPGGAGLAGAILVSGIHDPVSQPPSAMNAAYYGDDPAVLAEACCTDGLLATAVPLLFTVSEFDARDFQHQAALLAGAWQARHGVYPPLEYLAGHNHLSPAQAIGSPDDDLGPRLRAFIDRLSPR
jgi:arylformamidase